MLAVFEPDEYAQYPHPIRMITQKKTFRSTVWHFFAYQHYYYGFPFYLFSAVVIFPVKLLLGPGATQGYMLALRQIVSVLPMLLAVGIFVYLQTKFRAYWKSVVLFVLLLSIPAVVENNMWWHPDSLVILFVALTFFFLERDDFNLGKDYYLAAICVGLTTGTKMLGWFFFLTIFVYLLWGKIKKDIKWVEILKSGAIFILVMMATIVISNPMLLHPAGRSRIFQIQMRQAKAMDFGWKVAYSKGISAWAEIILSHYGRGFFILLSIASLIFGVIKNRQKALWVLIAAWIVPLSVYILFFVAIKPKHLLLPVILPLYSCLDAVFPLKGEDRPTHRGFRGAQIFIGVMILAQMGFFLKHDIYLYREKLMRVETSPSIQFYQQLHQGHLHCIEGSDEEFVIFRDVRTYVPDSKGWDVETTWGLIDYQTIQELDPELFVIQKQTILDYTQPDSIEEARNPNEMIKSQEFLFDVSHGEVDGYGLLLKNDFAYAFVRTDAEDMLTCSK